MRQAMEQRPLIPPGLRCTTGEAETQALVLRLALIDRLLAGDRFAAQGPSAGARKQAVHVLLAFGYWSN